MCLANDIRSPEAIDRLRPVKGAGRSIGPAPDEGADGSADQRADHALGRRLQRHCRRHGRAHESEGAAAPPAHHASAVVLDPAITVHTPEWLWLSTGIRAVDHCVEGVCSNEAHAYADAQALKGWRCWRAGCRASRRTRRTSPHGSIARWARGYPWARSPAACRWARAMASAMCWAPSSACRTGTPPASCCRRSCAGTSRSTPIGRPWSSAAMAQAGSDAGDVLDAFIGGLGMPRSLGAVKIGRDISSASPSRPWARLGCRATRGPSRGPAEVREILELAA